MYVFLFCKNCWARICYIYWLINLNTYVHINMYTKSWSPLITELYVWVLQIHQILDIHLFILNTHTRLRFDVCMYSEKCENLVDTTAIWFQCFWFMWLRFQIIFSKSSSMIHLINSPTQQTLGLQKQIHARMLVLRQKGFRTNKWNIFI